MPILYRMYVMDIMHIMSIACGLYMSNFICVMYGCIVGCMSYMSYKTNISSGNQTWQWKMDHFSMIFLAREPCLMKPEGTIGDINGDVIWGAR